MTNRDIAEDWANQDSANPYQDLDELTALLDAAEKRGELKGRAVGRVEECASIHALLGMLTGEPECPEVVLKFYDALTQRLAQLRAESEAADG